MNYVQKRDGIHVKPSYEREMMRLWKRSSVMPFSRWNPPRNARGEPIGLRWHQYYRMTVKKDVRQGVLTRSEGAKLVEYLDILGT